jgi:hypothetical protein
MLHAAVYPPVKLSSIDDTIFSIDAEVPAEVRHQIQRYAEEDCIPWATEAEHALALYRNSFMSPDDHARANLEDRIRALSEPLPKIGSKRRDNLRRHGQREIDLRRAAGEIGNFILPIELYDFVRSSLESGKASSVAEIFTNALPFLIAERGNLSRCRDAMSIPLEFV